MASTPQGREETIMPLPLTAILIEHDDHWTGWIVELPHVGHSAATREELTSALKALALVDLTEREPDFPLTDDPAPTRKRPDTASVPPRTLHTRVRALSRLFRTRRSTPRLDLCRSIRVQRRTTPEDAPAKKKGKPAPD
jgi:hypothetical protein